MINRYRTQCQICNHQNTLRITLGTDSKQEHTFACAGCGEPNTVALTLDHKKRKSFPELSGLPMPITAPTVNFVCIESCELSEIEGTITNLDPTFLVSEDMLHADGIFPWMHEMRKIGIINPPAKHAPKMNDVIWGLGGQRNFREVLTTVIRSYNLENRQQHDLSKKQLKDLEELIGVPNNISLNFALLVVACSFLGQHRNSEIDSLLKEVSTCTTQSKSEYLRFKQYIKTNSQLQIDRLVHVVNDYLQAYDQLFQVWIYVARNTELSVDSIASSRDFKKVKMFYGNAFEELSAGLWLPACLNNIKSGRPYDQFKEMSLAQYLQINKASRANPFLENPELALLYDEFDSTLRNASHHGGIRLSSTSPNVIEYRSGDNGLWKKMSYAEYLVKCNRIMFCLMRLMAMHIAITEELIP